MENLIINIIEWVNVFIATHSILLSMLFGLFIVLLESIIPALPLSVFIAINVIAFGSIVGFIISWIGTMIGCIISYFIFNQISSIAYKKLSNKQSIINFIKKIDKINFSNLVLIMAMPFTPAFSINIAAGLSEMKFKKYFFALLCSKIFIVYFWAFISATFLESITDIKIIIEILILILGAFILSKIVNKKYNL